jgi:RNA polymerase sigma-B factor
MPALTAAFPGTPGVSPGPPAPEPRSSGEYDHLEPLFEQCARLPADHPRRRQLRDQLITGYLPVAQHIARKFSRGRENLDDLEQVATLGLIHAVDRFEPGRGINFLSFAVPTISGELLRHFRDRASVIRLPRRLRELQRSLHRATAELSQQLGRAPRPSEIAAHLGVDLDAVLDALQAQHADHCASLDEPAYDDAPSSPGPSRFEAVLAQVDPAIELVEFRESLQPLLDALPERERRILLLRFFAGLSQTQIAGQIGISQMHVSRLLAATLATLRTQLTTQT